MMNEHPLHTVLGWWSPDEALPATQKHKLKDAIFHLKRPVYLLENNGEYTAVNSGHATFGASQAPAPGMLPIAAYAPICSPEALGSVEFCRDHHLTYPYIAGAMANGITSEDIVEEMGRHGMVGFFGSGGLPVSRIEAAIERISRTLQERPYGFNLLHSPYDPALEAAIVDLYLQRGVHLVSASAYLGLTLPVVRYRMQGIHRDATGRIITPNRIIAKVSRIEVAKQFFSPPPEKFLRQVVSTGEITEAQAELASQIPMAQDLIAEADSGGHTDNRPAISLIPTMIALRDQLQDRYNYTQPLRVGAAGGIATPASAAAAFSMGAAFIVTGSVNQACVESGTSETVRHILADVQQADVTMAPAADMFEMGVKVQVVKRGTMFAMRGAKLYDLYRAYGSIEDIPSTERATLEQKFFRAPLEQVWQGTQEFFQDRDPKQIDRARRDPKYRMALIFRAYLGQASHWANRGDLSRKVDYQIWCGPAMGAFNEWVKGSFLEAPDQRQVGTVALNILYGAGIFSRLQTLRMQGARLAADCWKVAPFTKHELIERMDIGSTT